MRSNKRSRSQFEGTKSNMRQLVEDVFCGPPMIEPETQNPSKPGPDPESQSFYDLLRDADQPLWPGCELSILSLVVILFHIKATNKWSNKSLNDLLAVLQKAINGNARVFPVTTL
uniref:Uncharacterized protein n=1 Tax=Triticum urartu TaxID=4572 RepID=A0A8R7TTX3_TRIUA